MPQYAFDPTAALPSNRINNELRSINQVSGIAGTGYVVIPNAAPFYRENFALVRKSNGDILTEGTHFHLVYPWQQASDWIGKDVFGGFVFTDPNFADDVAYSYQTIGGTYVENHPVTMEEGFKLIGTVLTLDWDTLPTTFPPTPHSHPLENQPGMAQVFALLGDIKEAIESPERAIALADITDIDVGFINPILASLSQVESILGAYGPYAPAISSLQSKMADLHPYASINPTHTAFAIPLGGFFHIRVGYIDFTPDLGAIPDPVTNAPGSLTWTAFPNKALFVKLDVTLATNPDVYAPGHDIDYSTPQANGLDVLNITINSWDDSTDNQTRRLHYFAVGI